MALPLSPRRTSRAAVFAGDDKQECLRRGQEMAQKWEAKRPKVAAMLRQGLDDCLTVLDFPEGHRRRLGSTNMLELATRMASASR